MMWLMLSRHMYGVPARRVLQRQAIEYMLFGSPGSLDVNRSPVSYSAAFDRACLPCPLPLYAELSWYR